MKRYAAAVLVLLAVLVVLASTAGIQAASKLPRVGMLCAPACSGPSFDAFWEILRKLGWVEGTTVVIDRKEADLATSLRAPHLSASVAVGVE